MAVFCGGLFFFFFFVSLNAKIHPCVPIKTGDPITSFTLTAVTYCSVFFNPFVFAMLK